MNEKKLIELFDNHSFTQYANATELFVVNELKREDACKIVLYGAGSAGRLTLRYLKQMTDIHIDIIIDKNPTVKELYGIKVMSLEDFTNYNKCNALQFCALIAVFAYGSDINVRNEIDAYLDAEGCIKRVDFCPQIGALTKTGWYDYFIKNQDNLCQCMSSFGDDVSKLTFYEYIRAYLEGHSYRGETFPEGDKYFVLNDSRDEIIALDDERWINFGSYTGDTIYNYLEQRRRFDKIYAVEGDCETAKRLRDNLSFLPDDIRNRIEVINYFFGEKLGQKKVDEYFCGEKITYINMDIEGYEAEVLSSGQQLIKRCRPVLAICVYHKMDDLLTIPGLISEIVDDYVFYLRKYPSQMGDYFEGRYCINELVLYAVPQERIKKRD